jgi:phosphate transport system permease protein
VATDLEELIPPADAVGEPLDVPRSIAFHRSFGDRTYRALTQAAGLSTLAIMGLIGFFLVLKARPAFQEMGWRFFASVKWNPQTHGIASVVSDTVLVAIVALAIAVPAAIATALCINEYAPLALRRPLTSMIDLLAAIPSIIYGLWGRQVLGHNLEGVSRWLAHNLGFIPLFSVKGGRYDSSRFLAAVVVAIMVLPIATSIIRQVFSQTPPGEKEAALALGGTRWGMIRTVVIPYGRGGIIGGSMLGLGRALGETIAVALVLATAFKLDVHVLQPGGATIASLIAVKFGEAGARELSALMAAGLVLFVMTLLVNLAATAIISRSRSGAGVEL